MCVILNECFIIKYSQAHTALRTPAEGVVGRTRSKQRPQGRHEIKTRTRQVTIKTQHLRQHTRFKLNTYIYVCTCLALAFKRQGACQNTVTVRRAHSRVVAGVSREQRVSCGPTAAVRRAAVGAKHRLWTAAGAVFSCWTRIDCSL